jgi:hypothetical protein
VKVLERKEATADELAKGRQTLRDELLNDRRSRFFSAYMAKAREKMRININSQVLAELMA